MIPLLFALNVTTFPTDGAWSTGPVAGFRQVWIDPATVVAALPPLAGAPEGEPLPAQVGPGLSFTNPLDTWVKLSVNGTSIGEVTSFATVQLAGLRAGWYQVSLSLPNGFVRSFAVEVR